MQSVKPCCAARGLWLGCGPTNLQDAPVGNGHLQDLIGGIRSWPVRMLPILGLPAPLQVMTTVLRFMRGTGVGRSGTRRSSE
jgi:hypothetical protein